MGTILKAIDIPPALVVFIILLLLLTGCNKPTVSNWKPDTSVPPLEPARTIETDQTEAAPVKPVPQNIEPWVDYSELYKRMNYEPGIYYVLMTMDPCPPCDELKNVLRDAPVPPSIRLGLCELDKHENVHNKLMGNRPYPQLIRMQVREDRKYGRLVYWDRQQRLSEFLK